jgi:hypothetical protein
MDHQYKRNQIMTNLIEKIRHAQVLASEETVINFIESMEATDKQEKITLYCLPVHAKCKDEIDRHCFGDCGQISMGGVIDLGDRIGPCWVCTLNACPYEMLVTDVLGQSNISGEDVRVRILK